MPLEREPDFKPDAAKRLSHDDTRFALGRIAGFQYFIVAVFFFLITGFWVLQIRDGQSNSELAEHNRVKTVPVIAPRGKFLVVPCTSCYRRQDQTISCDMRVIRKDHRHILFRIYPTPAWQLGALFRPQG